jgi:hypothetical protein
LKLQELEIELNKFDLKRSLRLNEHTYIYDLKKFVESHVNTLKGNKGNKLYMPYYERLIKTLKLLREEERQM